MARWVKSVRVSDYDGHRETTYVSQGVDCEVRIVNDGSVWRYLLINRKHAVYGDVREEIPQSMARDILKSDARGVHADDYGRIQEALRSGRAPTIG